MSLKFRKLQKPSSLSKMTVAQMWLQDWPWSLRTTIASLLRLLSGVGLEDNWRLELISTCHETWKAYSRRYTLAREGWQDLPHELHLGQCHSLWLSRKCLNFFFLKQSPKHYGNIPVFWGFIKLYLSSFFMWKMSCRLQYDESFPPVWQRRRKLI